MKSLLIIAHGCRIEAANDEVHHLAQRIEQSSEPMFGRVAAAFLEITGPKVDAAITNLINEGATEIAVFPYFLVAGTHVARDIPRIIEEIREAYPDIRFEIFPHLGVIQGIDTLVQNFFHNGPSAG